MKQSASRCVMFAGAAAAGLLIAGCDASSTPDDGQDADAAPSFAFITDDISDFGQVQIEGMESVVEPLGGSITVFDGGSTSEEQNQACLDAVTSGRYNGIIVNPANAPGAVPCAEAAHGANIPVAALEVPIGPDETIIEPQVEGVVASVGFNNDTYGNLVADVLEVGCEGLDPCNYILIVGSASYQVSAAALDAIDERFGDDPRFVRLAMAEDEFNPDRGRQVAADLLAANPEVNVILNSSDSSAVQVARLLEEEGRTDVINLGDGGSRQGLAAIADGGIFATTMIKPFTMGEMAAQALVDAGAGNDVVSPAEVEELVLPSIVTGENVADVEGQWG